MTKTVLIGLDGATFTVLDSLIESGVMPFLKQFIAGGTRAELMSTPLPFSPPAWSTIMTGLMPGNHGVYDFVRITPAAGSRHPQYTLATSRDLHGETIWSIASRQGRRVTALNFLFMFPIRPIDGYIVPGYVPPRHLRRFVHPPDFFQILKGLPEFKPSELLLDLDLERESLQVLPDNQYDAWLRLHIRREEQWFSILSHLMEHDPTDLTAILFDGVDKLQHLCWRFLDPSLYPRNPSAWEQKVRELCLLYFRNIDRYLARIVSLSPTDTRFIIVSDHGFGPTAEIFYVNVLLHQHHYLQWATNTRVDTRGKQMTDGNRTPTVLFDWEHTLAYALTAGSNGIYINVSKSPGEPGVAPEEYKTFRDELTRVLLDFKHPVTGEPVVAKVLHRDESFQGRHMQDAPDLTLILKDYGFISILNAETIIRPRPYIAGTHNPAGIFLASGPGIKQATALSPMSIRDIAPLILYSLDLDVPKDFDGSVPESVMTAETLAAKPIHVGEATHWAEPALETGGAVMEGSDEEQILERLRALGYIE